MPTEINRSRNLWKGSSLLMALGCQLGIVALTTLIVVLVPESREEPEFITHQTIYLPQRELEHRVAVSEFQQQASRPVMMDRLVTSALVPDSIPSLPTLPTSNFTPLQTSDFLTQDADALLADSGIMGAVSGLQGAGQVASFFGIETSQEKIVICFDVSLSVKNRAESVGVDFEVIRQETIRLIENFNNSTLFSMIQFVRNYEVFQTNLIPGNRNNQAAAVRWMQNRFVTTGQSASLRNAVREDPNGIESVLRAAFAMEPEVIFILSDGNFFRTPAGGGGVKTPHEDIRRLIDELQRGMPRPVVINFLSFQMHPNDQREWARIVRSTGGVMREMGR